MKRIPNSEPDKDTIKFQVGKFKNSIATILSELDASTKKDGERKSASDIRDIENSPAKLFEEIKIMFQDLPSRIDRATPTEGRKRRRRIHPSMLEDIIHMTKDGKLGIRIALSFYKEKLPWVYDEGILLLNKMVNRKTPGIIKHQIIEFEELLMLSTRHPLFEEFLMEDNEDFFLFKELPKIILRNLEKIIYEHI